MAVSRTGCREAELDAGEGELALFPELVLLGRPPAGRFLGDVVAAGDVPLDQRKDRRAIAVGGELRAGEGVAIGADVAEPRRT